MLFPHLLCIIRLEDLEIADLSNSKGISAILGREKCPFLYSRKKKKSRHFSEVLNDFTKSYF